MKTAPLYEISTIETPEQIQLDLPLAGVGTRGLAYIIDFLWQLVPIVIAALLTFALLPQEVRPSRLVEKDAQGQPQFPFLALAFVSGVIFLVNFGYFALFEIIWKGQSPGKRILELRVVRDGGYPIDGRAAFLRNLLRVVDFLPAFYALGVASLFAGRKGKRIGDYAAGTFVVRERNPRKQLSVIQPGSWNTVSDVEGSVVAEFLSRRSQLPDDVRSRIGRDLANRVARRLGRREPVDPERFLEELLGDGHG